MSRDDYKPLVLVIDDESAMPIADLLMVIGFRAIALAGIPSPQQLHFREAPDVMLVDMMLAGPMNGSELAGALRRQGYSGPIIAVSASDLELKGARKSACFDALMAKPLDATDLSRTINSVMGLKHNPDHVAPTIRPVPGP